MRMIDEQYLKTPYYGSRRMTIYLRSQGHEVNRKRVQRLYHLMGIETIYPKKNLSQSNKGQKKYPYLLKNMKIDRANQVWVSDITYIPMQQGYMYLIAIMDLHSRFVLNWSVSNSMESSWCVAVLQEAMEKHGTPEYFNTDQGSQFAAQDWIHTLESVKSISVWMGKEEPLIISS